MRYLKGFNESKASDSDKLELKELCYNYISFLYDKGFKITIKDCVDVNLSIILHKGKETNNGSIYDCEAFKWDDIREDYIAFINFLKLLPDYVASNNIFFELFEGYYKPSKRMFATDIFIREIKAHLNELDILKMNRDIKYISYRLRIKN